MYEGLLLDVGGVILDPGLAVDAFETATGRTLPSRDGRGDDGLDAIWGRVAVELGYAGWRELFRAFIDAVPDQLFDRDAIALMHDARAAGRRVGILTNDAYSIERPEFFHDRPEFGDLDAFVDSLDIGVRKPAPEAFLAAATALGVAPSRVLFLDDVRENVDGATAVGMRGLEVDPNDRIVAFDEARRLLGIRSR
jgi:HAD superfamily hydrolase (TIGR01509 family)